LPGAYPAGRVFRQLRVVLQLLPGGYFRSTPPSTRHVRFNSLSRWTTPKSIRALQDWGAHVLSNSPFDPKLRTSLPLRVSGLPACPRNMFLFAGDAVAWSSRSRRQGFFTHCAPVKLAAAAANTTTDLLGTCYRRRSRDYPATRRIYRGRLVDHTALGAAAVVSASWDRFFLTLRRTFSRRYLGLLHAQDSSVILDRTHAVQLGTEGSRREALQVLSRGTPANKRSG